MLVALPAELLVHVIVQLAAAGDFARVAKVCAACNTAIGRAVTIHAQRCGLCIASPRPWVQITPWVRHVAGWSFVLRAAQVRPRVLMGMDQNAAQGAREWLWLVRNTGDAPTKWCIENELRIAEATRVEAELVAAAEQAARLAAERFAREELRRQTQKARLQARTQARNQARLLRLQVQPEGRKKGRRSLQEEASEDEAEEELKPSPPCPPPPP